MNPGLSDADSRYVEDAVELRGQVGRSLHARGDAIVQDALAVYPFAGIETIDADDRARVADLCFHLLTIALRDGVLDPDYAVVADLGRITAKKGVSIRV